MAPIRMTHPTALILTALAAGYRFGFDIMDATGLPSGTVYPALRRMQEARLVRSTWESEKAAHQDRRPRRKLYELTSSGHEAVSEAQARLVDTRRILDAKLGGAKT
jgi:PadR family transcriptional regulator PadR